MIIIKILIQTFRLNRLLFIHLHFLITIPENKDFLVAQKQKGRPGLMGVADMVKTSLNSVHNSVSIKQIVYGFTY